VSTRRTLLTLAGVGVVLGTASCRDLVVDSPEGIDALLSVSGPETLRVGESATLRTEVKDEQNRTVTSATMRWRVDQGALLSVATSTADTVRVEGLRPGSVTVTVETQGGPFKPTTQTKRVNVVLAGVRIGTGPAAATLTAINDTLNVQAGGLSVSDAMVNNTGLTWIKLGQGAVRMDTLPGRDVSRIVAVQAGTDTLIVNHAQCLGRCSDTLVVRVDPQIATVAATVESVRFASRGDQAVLIAQARDRRGTVVPGATLSWSLGDPAEATVVRLIDNTITAVGNGSARVIVRSGELADTVPVQVQQVATAITAIPGALALVKGTAAGVTVRPVDARGNAVRRAYTPTWAVVDGSVASVTPASDSTAQVATGAYGSTFIRVTVEGIRDSIPVAVGPASVRIAERGETINALGHTRQLTASAMDSQGNVETGLPFVWSSLDPAVASVDAGNGRVTAVANGAARIVATVYGRPDTVSVTVQQVMVRVDIAPADTSAFVDEVVQLRATARDSANAGIPGATFVWSSSNADVATVDENGRITSSMRGTATITATSGALSGQARVSFSERPLSDRCAGTGGTTHGSTIGESRTWTKAAGPHRVSSLTVNNNAVLQIEAGALVCMGSGATLSVNGGARLVAAGTANDPIIFTATNPAQRWNSIALTGTPGDTSRLTNTILEYGGQSTYAVSTDATHRVVLSGATVRQSDRGGVQLQAPGSRITGSSVEGTIFNQWAGVSLGSGTTMQQSVVSGAAHIGVYMEGTGATLSGVRVEESRGPGVWIGNGTGHRLNGVHIAGSGGTGLHVVSGVTLAQATGVRVVGGAAHPAELPVHVLHRIAPTTALQDSLRGNAMDTLIITGGTLKGRVNDLGQPIESIDLTARADLPWRVTGQVNVDSAATLTIQPGSQMVLHPGVLLNVYGSGRLVARGTAQAPIVMRALSRTQRWGGIRLTGTPGDTSFITNARLEHTSGWGGYSIHVDGPTHRVAIDSVVLQKSDNGAIHVASAGSRISRVLVDTATVNTNYAGIHVNAANVKLEGTTVRETVGGGVYVSGANVTLSDVLVQRAGQYGMGIGNAAQALRLNGVRIEQSGGTGLFFEPGATIAQATGLRVVGGAAHGAQLPVHVLHRIAPTTALQDSLRGNAMDTLIITGGTLKGRVNDLGQPIESIDLTARADLPWRVTGQVNVDSAATLTIQPGSQMVLHPGVLLNVYGSGRLVARGTAQAPIVMRALSRTQRWGGIRLTGTPGDTSFITNARLEHTSGWGGYSIHVDGPTHRVAIDSVVLQKSDNGAIHVASAGSRISRVLVDTATVNTNYAGIHVNAANVKLEGTTVRQTVGDGIWVTGANATLSQCAVLNSGRDGVHVNATGVRINQCNLLGHAEAALRNGNTATTHVVDATNNWWGAASGPPTSGANRVTANVNFNPWRTEPVNVP
jgi:uncharacterized protein YjdB